tara:strand:- start:26 stop:880 length:855 start_codon:yes stop_codon:yes gene_type:complete
MTLKYPAGAGAAGSDYVIFTPIKYRTNDAQRTDPGGAPPPDSDAQSVILYMPNSTPGMGNQNDWNKVDFNGPIGDMRRQIGSDTGATMAKFMANGGGGPELLEGAGELASNTIDKLKSNFKGIGSQLGMQALGSVLAVTPNQMLAMGAGQVFNPNVELLYNAPQMRGFGMSFDMVPKDASEANVINQIIMNFKKWSSPEAIENGMMEIPYVWEVKYMTGQSVNKNMNRFKKAACTNVQVQANSPTPMHVAHLGGVPIVTSLQLTFTEVDIITRKDHTAVGGQGY